MTIAGALLRPSASMPGVLFGLAGVVAVVALLPTSDAALLPVFGVALVLGASFVLTEFGFTAGFRDLLARGDGRSIAATLIVPAVAAAVIVPVATLGDTHERYVAPIGLPLFVGAAIGGVLMGVGARLSFGCTIGAVVGGLSSGSLHGLAWLIAALPGCWLGIRVRPMLGMRAG